ncbi:MAG: FAD-binding oxidoreductase [Planctomycetes bacterium]|nr:FAD-binding oxidoreductase [Planctomycetota bacterium]
MRVRTLIVGGGVMGTAIAAAVARGGDPLEEPVLLLERRALGAGSSGRSGAILRQFYSDRPLIGMARDSLRSYASFEFSTGRAIGFTRCGVLTLASPRSKAAFELLLRNVESMRDCGVEVELVDSDRLRELVPGIEVASDTRAAWEPKSGFVDPQRTLEAFAATARSLGATVRCGVEVTGLQVRAGRVTSVETSDGPVDAQRVVVAAGPWTRALLARAGIELPLRAIRPEQHFVAMPPARDVHALGGLSGAPDADFDARFARAGEPAPAHPVLLDLEHGYYTRCEPRLERTRVGALDYARDATLADPDALDERVSAEFSRWSREVLERRLPVYRGEPDRGAQAAWYTLTPDAQALIGRVPGLDNVYVVAGFSGHGFKLAPSVGEGVAQMLAGAPIGAFEPEVFAPERFASRGGAVWSGAFGL